MKKFNLDNSKDRLKFLLIPFLFLIISFIVLLFLEKGSIELIIVSILALIFNLIICINAIILVRYDHKKMMKELFKYL